MKVEIVQEAWISNLSKKHRLNFIANIASISYGNDFAKEPKKLVKYLIERGHQSLFEFIRFPYITNDGCIKGFSIEDSLRHNPGLLTFYEYNELVDKDVDLTPSLIEIWKSTLVCLKIETPIFVDRQLVRHRSDSRIELSRRYVKPDKVKFSYWFPEILGKDIVSELESFYNDTYQKNLELFKRAELARFNLPLNLYTKYYVLRDFKGARNFYVRRYSKHAQKETRELVELELYIIQENQPEFLGISFDLPELELFDVKIWDLQKIGKQYNKDILLVEYGDKHYYAQFDVETGLFIDDALKPSTKKTFFIAFGIE